jgi:hypothetical protein
MMGRNWRPVMTPEEVLLDYAKNIQDLKEFLLFGTDDTEKMCNQLSKSQLAEQHFLLAIAQMDQVCAHMRIAASLLI